MWVTRCEHYVCTKKLKTLPKKTPKKNIKELKNHTQKNNKIADAVVLVVLFLFFMFYVTYVTGQNLHVYSQQYLPYTSVNSSSENLGFKSNNISNWYLSLPPGPPPPLPHLSAWNVLLLLEEVSFWSALRFSCVTEVTRGKEKMHWIPNYCSFFHLSSCAIQSLRLFGFNPFTPMRDQDRISPYNINATSNGQVMRIQNNITQGIISWSNAKFSKLTSQELYGRQ